MLQEATQDIQQDDLAVRILQHWQSRIAATPPERDPFDHIYLEDIWPGDIYRDLLSNLPPLEFYEPINIKRWVRENGESTRDRIKLTSENIESWPKNLRDFWRQIARAIYSDELKEAMFSKLRGDIALRLDISPEEVAEAPVLVAASLVRDTEEYEIKPHPDGYPRVVTMQFYLPEGHDQLDLGTSLYVEEPKWRRLVGKRFREAKRFRFQPKSAYAFAVNDRPERRSLHGRELINAESGVRNSLLLAWQVEAQRKNKMSAGEAIPTTRVLG